MENYTVSLNDGIDSPDYCAFQIFNQNGEVVAIARTSKIELLELEKTNGEVNNDALLDAIKDRFPGICIKNYKDTTRKRSDD